MFAKLTALVGGGYTFGYNVEEPYPHAWGQWTHHRGSSKEDASAVSVFKMSAADPNDRRLVIARNNVKRLRMLRHPNILAFKDSAEVQEKGQTVLYLVTQPVKPLKSVLEELNLQGQHRDEYLAMGILHMTNSVSFLNNDCKLIHGNICLDAVVVTETLDWKLHGFDLLSEQSLPGDHCLMHASWLVGNQYKPAELAKAEWDTIRNAPPWAVDAWGLGCLIQEVFNQEYMTSVEQLRRTTVIPPALLGDYQKLLSSTAARRLNPAKVAESKFLNNRLVDVVAFMENIAVKDSADKDLFFKRMGAAVPCIPQAVAVRKILPQLSHALEFGGAPPSAVGPLLQIGSTLEGDDFNKRVVPTLSKLFAAPDRALRRSLLESIDSYATHLTTSVLEEQIFVHLQTGFTDANAYIRELTLKSMLSLAPKLSNKTLVNNVLKHLSKLQVDEEPSIRANTTVLLGNVAKYLGDATCKRVLVNAFTRALKDQFPPAKIAGLRAMVATQQYHGTEDAALRIIPSTAPLALDPLPEVRATAIQTLEVFVAQLRDEDKKRAQELAASGEAHLSSSVSSTSAGAGTSSSAVALGSLAASSAAAAGSSMLNWAVSSLISSTGLAVKPATGPAAAAAAAGGAGGAAAPSSGPAGGAVAGASGAGLAGSMPSRQSGGAVAPVPPPSAAAAGGAKTSSSQQGNGWGVGDGWDEDEALHVDKEELKARSRLAALASSSRPATGRSTAASSATTGAVAAASDSWDGEKDAGGWDSMETSAAPAARPRPARPTSGTGAAGAKPKAGGGMKLGVQKLGASKAPGAAGLDFDDVDKW